MVSTMWKRSVYIESAGSRVHCQYLIIDMWHTYGLRIINISRENNRTDGLASGTASTQVASTPTPRDFCSAHQRGRAKQNLSIPLPLSFLKSPFLELLSEPSPPSSLSFFIFRLHLRSPNVVSFRTRTILVATYLSNDNVWLSIAAAPDRLHRLQYGSQTGLGALGAHVNALSPIHNRRKSRSLTRSSASFRDERRNSFGGYSQRYHGHYHRRRYPRAPMHADDNLLRCRRAHAIHKTYSSTRQRGGYAHLLTIRSHSRERAERTVGPVAVGGFSGRKR